MRQTTDTGKTPTKMQRYRARLRAKGLRPVQIWMPDTRSKAFVRAIREQSLRASAHPSDKEALDFIESVFEWPDY